MISDPLFAALPDSVGDNKRKRELCTDRRLRWRFEKLLAVGYDERQAVTVALRSLLGIERA